MEIRKKLKVLIPFSIFVCLYVLFLVTHYTNNLSLYFDIPACFSVITASLIVQNKKEVDKLLFPSTYFSDYSP